VAIKIGMSYHVYKTIEEGTTRRFGKGMRERLAGFFGVPASDFEDEFNRFCEDGQGSRIQAWRSQTGLNRQAFADRYGIPVQSLEAWENKKRAVTYKSWEKYFKGRV
jgi:transcriptional regulator with XRE-family HTH domain